MPALQIFKATDEASIETDKYLHKHKQTDKSHCHRQLAQEDAVDFANKTCHKYKKKPVNSLAFDDKLYKSYTDLYAHVLSIFNNNTYKCNK